MLYNSVSLEGFVWYGIVQWWASMWKEKNSLAPYEFMAMVLNCAETETDCPLVELVMMIYDDVLSLMCYERWRYPWYPRRSVGKMMNESTKILKQHIIYACRQWPRFGLFSLFYFIHDMAQKIRKMHVCKVGVLYSKLVTFRRNIMMWDTTEDMQLCSGTSFVSDVNHLYQMLCIIDCIQE